MFDINFVHIAFVLDGMYGELEKAWQARLTIAQDFIQELERQQNSGHAIEDVGPIDFCRTYFASIRPQ